MFSKTLKIRVSQNRNLHLHSIGEIPIPGTPLFQAFSTLYFPTLDINTTVSTWLERTELMSLLSIPKRISGLTGLLNFSYVSPAIRL
jgi:hypothetical protein